MDLELKKLLREEQKKVISEYKARKRFLNINLDYNYLQYMINRCDCDDNLEIVIDLNNGTRITIHKKYKQNNKGESLYDDVISPDDMEI